MSSRLTFDVARGKGGGLHDYLPIPGDACRAPGLLLQLASVPPNRAAILYCTSVILIAPQPGCALRVVPAHHIQPVMIEAGYAGGCVAQWRWSGMQKWQLYTHAAPDMAECRISRTSMLLTHSVEGDYGD